MIQGRQSGRPCWSSGLAGRADIHGRLGELGHQFVVRAHVFYRCFQLFRVVIKFQSLCKRPERAKTGDAVMCHALILRNDGGIEHRAIYRSIFDGVLDGFLAQAFHALAMHFFHFVVMLVDQGLEQLRVLANALLRFLKQGDQLGVLCLRQDFGQSLGHLVVGRLQIFQFIDIKLFERGDFRHLLFFSQ